MKPLRLVLSGLALASLILSGCGTTPGAGTSLIAVAEDGLSRFGFGAEGGESPSLALRQDGSIVLAYAGTNTGDRRIFWAQSTDGSRFTSARPVDTADYSDAEPCLVEDAAGTLHLFFASNRTGDDYRLYHSTLSGKTWSAPAEVPGFEGLQGLAVAYEGGRFLLASEILGAGLFVSESTDGETWSAGEAIATVGFEPALTVLPDGQALVAYQHHGKIYYRASADGGDWSPEALAVAGSDRLRTPALAWSGDHGELVYTERTPAGYRLSGVRFDADLKFGGDLTLPTLPGTARTPALVSDSDARSGLAWGIKLSSGQEGIALTLQGDR